MTQSQSLTKNQAQHQQTDLQKSGQHARDVETHEHNASASGSAGLNLNLFGALSGAFSSKSKKTTHEQPDGSKMSVEDKEDRGAAQGHAQGQGNAYAAGEKAENVKHEKSREIGQSAHQGQKKVQKVDHLGIEG